MSSSKAVYSFFDPAEIKKSFSGKATASPSNSPSVNQSYESAASHDREGRSRSFSSATSHSGSQVHGSYSSNPNGSYESHNTGNVSIEYDENSSCSGGSAMTERRANKSPEVVVRGGRLHGAKSPEMVRLNDANVSGGLGSTSGLSSASGGMGSDSNLGRRSNSDVDKGSAFERTASNASGLSANTAPASIGGVHGGNSNTMLSNLTREANYEEGASELFLLVENAAWQEAITRYVHSICVLEIGLANTFCEVLLWFHAMFASN